MVKRPSVITLGTFDGVHRGHRRILDRVVEHARQRRSRSVVLAFGMPPRHAGRPVREAVLLTTLPEKIELLKRIGVDEVHVLRFDRKTASTPPERFFRETMVERHGAKEIIIGPRVAFGKDRAGRLPLLRRLGREAGVRVSVVGAVRGADADISSRRVRSLLSRGNVEKARELLGYPYSAAGNVVHGQARGRRIGFPTANIDAPPDKILPRGVFWVKVLPIEEPLPLGPRDLRAAIDGLCNVGTRPTFKTGTHELRCEVFLLEPPRLKRGTRSFYGRGLRVVFMRRIRAEKRFVSPQALARQIRHDLQTAEGWIRRFSLQ